MNFDRRDLIRGALAAPLLFASQAAFGKQPFKGPGDWNAWFRDWLLRDFGMIGYYADDNAKLLASREPVDIVFLGNSITEGWFDKRPSFFTRGRVDRGIGGQTSSQMVLRMMTDVGRAEAQGGAHHGWHERHRRQHRADDAGNDAEQFPRDERHRARATESRCFSHPFRRRRISLGDRVSRPAQPIAAMNRWLKQFAP